MIRREVRRARKPYRCDGRVSHICHRQIGAGEYYLLSVASPNHDLLGNVGWWQLRACAPCALMYGTEVPDMTAVDPGKLQ